MGGIGGFVMPWQTLPNTHQQTPVEALEAFMDCARDATPGMWIRHGTDLYAGGTLIAQFTNAADARLCAAAKPFATHYASRVLAMAKGEEQLCLPGIRV